MVGLQSFLRIFGGICFKRLGLRKASTLCGVKFPAEARRLTSWGPTSTDDASGDIGDMFSRFLGRQVSWFFSRDHGERIRPKSFCVMQGQELRDRLEGMRKKGPRRRNRSRSRSR